MIPFNGACSVIVLIGSLLTGSMGHAAVVVSNLNENSNNGVLFNASNWAAMSFTVDGNNYVINSVTIPMQGSFFGTTFDFNLDVFSNSGDRPGSSIGPLFGSDPNVRGTYTYNGAISVAANTTYWLVLHSGSDDPGHFSWQTTDSIFETGSWTIGDARFSSPNGGDTWFGPARPGMFSIDATLADATSAAAPEPSSFAICSILALTGIGFRRVRARLGR